MKARGVPWAARTWRAAVAARAWRAAVGAFAIATTICGCAVGPDFRRPEPPAVDRYLPPDEAAAPAPDGAPRFDEAAEAPADWWTRFRSPALDALVADALQRSPTLKASEATLRQAQDTLRAGDGVFYPQVAATASGARQDSIAIANRSPVASGPYSLGTLSASVGYAPDLFGLQRRTVEALGAKVDEQRNAVVAARTALAANVVNAAIARAGYEAQRDALRQVIGMQAEQVRIAQVQFDAGTAAYAPVAALRSQRAANEATLASLEQRIDQGTHLLALLGGTAPAQAQLPSIALDAIAMPDPLPLTLPSTLARRRPDILQAEAQLHAASAQIGIATADLFPSVALTAAGGEAHGAVSQLLQAGTRFWSAQASLAASLFSGGSQWYARRAAIDAYDAALETYRQTVLAALAQVADTLRALSHDAQQLQADREAESAASENLRLTRANFEAGTAGYLELLTADTQLQQSRLAVLGATAQRLQDTVALYVSLGSGLEMH